MTQVKYLSKKNIDCSLERQYDKNITDKYMFTFEVKIIVPKNYCKNQIKIGDSDSSVFNWFRNLYFLFK